MNIWNIVRRWLAHDKNQPEERKDVYTPDSSIVPIKQETIGDIGVSLFEGIDESFRNTSQESETKETGKQVNDISDFGIIKKPDTKQNEEMKPEVDEPPVVPEPPSSSLLDNKEYIRLLEECAALIAEFEQYHTRLTSEEGKMMVEMFAQRLREAMLLSGAQSIDCDSAFNILRHTPVPMRYIVNDTPIEEIFETGIAIENRVFVKAKVRVKELKNDYEYASDRN